MASNLQAKVQAVSSEVSRRIAETAQAGIEMRERTSQMHRLRGLAMPIQQRLGKLGAKAAKTPEEEAEYSELAKSLSKIGDLMVALKQAKIFPKMQPFAEGIGSKNGQPACEDGLESEEKQNHEPKGRYEAELQTLQAQLKALNAQIALLDGSPKAEAQKAELVFERNTLAGLVKRVEVLRKIAGGSIPDLGLSMMEKEQGIFELEGKVSELEDCLEKERLKQEPDAARLRMLQFLLQKNKRELKHLLKLIPLARVEISEPTSGVEWEHFITISGEGRDNY